MTPGSIGGSRPGPKDPGSVSPRVGKFSEQVWGISSERQQAGASHGLIARLDQLAARPGHQLTYSVGWELGARERAAIRLVPAARPFGFTAAGPVRASIGRQRSPNAQIWVPPPVTNGLAKQDERHS